MEKTRHPWRATTKTNGMDISRKEVESKTKDFIERGGKIKKIVIVDEHDRR